MLQKKIAFIIPSLEMGGMERVMSQIVNYFSSKRLATEIHLIILTRNKKQFMIHPDVIIHEPDFDNSKLSFVVNSVKSIRYLRKIFKNIDPDVILSFGDRYNSLVILCSMFLKSTVFVSNRMNPTLSNGKVIDLLNKLLYRFSDGIIAQTKFAREVFLKRYGNKNVIVIANPIKFVNIDSHDITIERENIILNVGRFVNGKNQHLLVKYFKTAGIKDWKIVFLGEGPKLQGVKDYVERLGMRNCVEFHGNVNNIDDFYVKSKVFAFTSSTEGFPNVLGEAMSAKLACISFDCITGPGELIDDGINGYLIPLLDEDKYIEKLRQLIGNEEIRKKMGNNALEKLQLFTIDKICKRYYNIFKVD